MPGVPGGSTRGGRESAPPGSPTHDLSKGRKIDDRLLLASQAIELCPNLIHCNLEMFGVRHSSLLTSHDYITEETNKFRTALSQLKHLKTFSWLTPKENINFKGFSVAVVDLAFEPLIEGLELAAIDMDVDGRRIIVKDGWKRYCHPLEEFNLHHCNFPSNRGKQLFQLFAKMHPDDQDRLLFPNIRLICIKKAINVDPINVALLAIFWQLQQVDENNQDWNPKILLEDVFVNSIWGPRLSKALLLKSMYLLVNAAMLSCQEESSSSSSSNNVYIRALEESVEIDTKLDERSTLKIYCMEQWQRDRLIHQACKRVDIQIDEGFIAGHQ